MKRTRLQLNRQTLRSLTPGQLGGAIGGETGETNEGNNTINQTKLNQACGGTNTESWLTQCVD